MLTVALSVATGDPLSKIEYTKLSFPKKVGSFGV